MNAGGRVSREELDRFTHAPVRFDALVGEENGAYVFEKTVTLDDPGVAEQRVTPTWPHHLPGELTIALTGQAGIIPAPPAGLLGDGGRGHGGRPLDAPYSAPVAPAQRVFPPREVRARPQG